MLVPARFTRKAKDARSSDLLKAEADCDLLGGLWVVITYK